MLSTQRNLSPFKPLLQGLYPKAGEALQVTYLLAFSYPACRLGEESKRWLWLTASLIIYQLFLLFLPSLYLTHPPISGTIILYLSIVPLFILPFISLPFPSVLFPFGTDYHLSLLCPPPPIIQAEIQRASIFVTLLSCAYLFLNFYI